MKDKALGLLICIGIILYMINSIGPYIFIGLVVIALILIIVFLSINESAKSLNKEKTVYDQPSRTKLIDPIREGRVLSASIKSNSFVEDQKLIQSFVNAYNEVDNSLDTIKRMNKILRCCQRFYSKQAYTKRNLFSFIIEEANNAKQTTISPRLIRECETIITEMLQLKNGITTESIINQNIENKKQITQHLIKQDTRLNNFKVEDFNNSSEYHINSRIENINSFNKEEIPDTIEEAYVPIPVKKPTTFDEEYKIIQSLIKAHNESDNSVETNNWIIRILRFISKFYTKQASKNRNLFDFIIEEANYEILNAKPLSL